MNELIVLAPWCYIPSFRYMCKMSSFFSVLSNNACSVFRNSLPLSGYTIWTITYTRGWSLSSALQHFDVIILILIDIVLQQGDVATVQGTKSRVALENFLTGNIQPNLGNFLDESGLVLRMDLLIRQFNSMNDGCFIIGKRWCKYVRLEGVMNYNEI